MIRLTSQEFLLISEFSQLFLKKSEAVTTISCPNLWWCISGYVLLKSVNLLKGNTWEVQGLEDEGTVRHFSNLSRVLFVLWNLAHDIFSLQFPINRSVCVNFFSRFVCDISWYLTSSSCVSNDRAMIYKLNTCNWQTFETTRKEVQTLKGFSICEASHAQMFMTDDIHVCEAQHSGKVNCQMWMFEIPDINWCHPKRVTSDRCLFYNRTFLRFSYFTS